MIAPLHYSDVFGAPSVNIISPTLNDIRVESHPDGYNSLIVEVEGFQNLDRVGTVFIGLGNMDVNHDFKNADTAPEIEQYAYLQASNFARETVHGDADARDYRYGSITKLSDQKFEFRFDLKESIKLPDFRSVKLV